MVKMKYLIILAISLLVMTGCSSHQVNELGLINNHVNGYPQQMSNLQLCDVYLGELASAQTRVALASEWKRRKLSRQYCQQQNNEWYLTRFTKWLIKSNEPSKQN